MALSRPKRTAIGGLIALKHLELAELEEIKRRKRKLWVNPFLAKREMYDIEEHLLKDLMWGDGENYRNFCRMTRAQFEEVLTLVEPSIKKQHTRMRYAISARVRLAVTLRYVATGDSYRSLENLTRVSRKAVSGLIPEVLSAIYEALQPTHLVMSETEREWLDIAQDFNDIWDFPHTLGAMDGKHIRIVAPPKSGSDFFNYKSYFSIVLFAIVNAHSKFIYIYVGANGRASDNVIYKSSPIYNALKCNQLHIPNIEQLPGQIMKTPYFFIGDDIFGLDKHLMKGFSRNKSLSVREEVLNFRLSRFRMTVEMAFGRLASRFRIFHRPIEVNVGTADLIVNYLSANITTAPLPGHENDGMDNLPNTITALDPQEFDNPYKYACKIRDELAAYLVTDGDVPYQWDIIKRAP